MTKLFVGSLSFQTTDQELLNTFSQYGAVESASIVTDRFSGQSRGFGFVEMAERSAAEAAIAALDGATLDGRTIHVSEARPKAEGGGSRGGGGGFNRSGQGRPSGGPPRSGNRSRESRY